jgi:hypothetical protein
MKIVATVTHPETKDLTVDIIEMIDNGTTYFYYDENGDWYKKDEKKAEWYDKKFWGFPLEACKAHAMETLNEKYNGTYYTETEGERSERITFSAMQS